MITKTFETDQEAQLLLKEKLPKSWLFREQNPDVHIDYYIEIVNNQQPTGQIFAVQLKGTRQIKIRRGLVIFQFKTKQLVYYLEKIKIPVYLIIADVIDKKCYWLFLQEYVKNEFKNEQLNNQNKVTLKIPVKNLLSDIDKFSYNFAESEKYVRDLFPSSIPASISAQQEHWKNLDPRIDVEVYHKNDHTSFKLIPKEKFDLSFRFKNDINNKLAHNFEKSIKKGSPIEFDSSNIDFMGSPLISEFISNNKTKGKVKFSPINWIKGSTIFETINESNFTSTILSNIDGKLLFNETEFNFIGELLNAPLKIDIKGPIEPHDDKNVAHINCEFLFKNWEKKSIISLPYRERLFNLLLDIKNGNSLRIHIDYEGNNIYKSNLIRNPDFGFNSIYWIFEFFHKAAKVLSILKQDIIVPENREISDDDIDTVNVLYDVLSNGKHEKIADNMSFSATLLPNEQAIIKIKNGEILNGDLRFVDVKEYFIFDQQVKIDKLLYEITNAKLLTDLSTIKTEDLTIGAKIPLKWSGQSKSKLIIKKNE